MICSRREASGAQLLQPVADRLHAFGLQLAVALNVSIRAETMMCQHVLLDLIQIRCIALVATFLAFPLVNLAERTVARSEVF